ncbi:hypothetical protein Tco_0670312 [Tanacetum coccineum]
MWLVISRIYKVSWFLLHGFKFAAAEIQEKELLQNNQFGQCTARCDQCTAEKIKVPLLFVKVPLVLSDILERTACLIRYRNDKKETLPNGLPQARKQSDQASSRSPSRHLEAPLRIIGSGLPRRAIPGDKTQQPPQSKHEDTTACCFHHPSSNGARDEYHRAATPTHSKQGSEFRVTTPMEGVATELGD